ncbi:MAG: hypothetical protein GX145_04845 [Clostridiaceae bacterium]|jgi:hypothetical protein|nr:hypothetical protein [Bacillota bacterium]NLN52121.1 hypothetical protein [Clostridiaceae bacterium]
MTKKVLKISITIILIFSLTSCSFFKDFLNRDKSKEIEKSEIAEEIEKSEIADETDENIDINKQRRMNVKPEDVEWEMDTVSQNYLIALNAFLPKKKQILYRLKMIQFRSPPKQTSRKIKFSNTGCLTVKNKILKKQTILSKHLK